MRFKLPFRADVPPGLTRLLSRYATPLAVVAVLLVLGTATALAALMTPAGLPLATTKVSRTVDLPETFRTGLLDEVDSDLDGLGDALENYVYGTDPENWDSSGMGIPDGWLVTAGFDPLSPATRTARGKLPAPSTLPPAYGGAWPAEFLVPLGKYYDVGKPADYAPGESPPWWVGDRFANPSQETAPSGLPTAWLVRYGLDPNDPAIGDAPAPGGDSPLTVREAFEHNTNPLLADGDGDGLLDVDEIRIHFTDPSRFSTSLSGIADGWAVHYGLDPRSRSAASEDADQDGLTNLEEFVRSYRDFEDDVASEGIGALFTRGLDPLDWQTSGSGIPDGWFVAFGLSPYDPTEADRVLQRASNFRDVRWLDDAPDGHETLPDLVMSVRDAYAHGRPASWDEAVDGVWWGGTNPAEIDSDGDGLPDAVEMRGWYVNVTFGLGPQAEGRWLHVVSNPMDPDSDADGLTDAEEYHASARCATDDVRAFKPTDPRNKDTAFSGLTDREKVCGIVRGAFVYDLAKDGGAGLDPTRADSAGDYMRDGAKVDHWHERYLGYLSSTTYEFPNSSFGSIFDWTKRYSRFAGVSDEDVVKQFRPDGDVDGDGIVNVLDQDPSGGLVDVDNPRAVHFPQGLQIDPELYRFSEYRSPFPRSRTDPANPDTDGDGLPDWWEVKFGVYVPEVGGWNLDPSRHASLGDGVPDWKRNDDGDVVPWYAYRTDASGRRTRVATGLDNQPYEFGNLQEFLYGTNPNVVSTAGDGIPDGWKVFWGIVYPTLAAQGAAGDLSDADLAAVRQGSGAIGPLADLKDQGNPLKTQGYARFVNVTSCDDLSETRLRELKVLRGSESFAPESATGRVPCPVATLAGPSVPVARIAGLFELTYRHEATYGTNPYLVDTDGDGSPDANEVCFMYSATPVPVTDRTETGCAGQALPSTGPTFPNPTVPEARVDRDGDGVDLADECGHVAAIGACSLSGRADQPGGSNPNLYDTDLDGVSDGLEIQAGLDPLNPGDVSRFKSTADTDRDGVLDYQELTGWYRDEATGLLVKTSPSDPDSDDVGCRGTERPWGGDNLLDGAAIELDPTGDADLVAEWKSLGMAWTEVAGKVRFLGEEAFTNPRLGDSSCDGIPDGWRVYYYVAEQRGREPGAADHGNRANYETLRPEWWDEAVHSTWWWGAPPAGSGDGDLDNDGLDDRLGEDPFPATSLNRYSYGAFTSHDPEEAAAFVQAAPTVEEARLRAQAWGDLAGNPAKARRDADAEPRFPAATRLVDVAVTEGAVSRGGVFEVQKGVEFVVTGRLVVDEGSSPDDGEPVPHATVLASALTRDPAGLPGSTFPNVLGAAFTNGTGHFTLRVNVTTTHAVDAPNGAVLLGRIGGDAPIEWEVDPQVMEVGAITRGSPNQLVVWSYRTPSAPTPGSPYASYAFHKAGGSVADAVLGAEADPIPLEVVSGTRAVFDVAEPALNGGVLHGTVTLTDASGAPLADRNVTLRWSGAGSTPLVVGESNVKVRTDDDGVVNLTSLRVAVGTEDAGAYLLEVGFYPERLQDPFLRPSVTATAVDVRTPVELTATASGGPLQVGADFVVEGALRSLPYDVPGAPAVPSAPASGEVVVLEIGSTTVTARTDSNGRFHSRLQVPGDVQPGDAHVKVSFAGTGSLDGAGPVEVPLTVKRSTRILGVLDHSTARGSVVAFAGTLQDARGEGVPGRALGVLLGGLPVASVTTGADGSYAVRFTVPLSTPFGATDLLVRFGGDDEYAAATNASRVKVSSPTTIEVTTLTNPVVRGGDLVLEGRLLDGAHRGVPSAAVDFFWKGVPVAHAITDDAGRFRVSHPVNGTEQPGIVPIGLHYRPPPTSTYRPSTAAGEVRVLVGVTLELAEREVRRGLVTLDGRLLDDRGNALPGQRVALDWGGAAVGEARTVRNGSYSVPYDVPASKPPGVVKVTASFDPPIDSRFAPARVEAEHVLRGTPSIVLTEASLIIRGEDVELAGTLLADNGAPLSGRIPVTLGERLLGEAVARDGRFQFRAPVDAPRGDALLALSFAGSRFLDPARLEVPVVVKIRPQVQLDLPGLAVQGLAYSGDLLLTDDLGNPLRNQTFVYAFAGSSQPILASTDAEGRASLGGVARGQSSFVALTVKGGPDVQPTEYRTSTVRVLGPSASPALGVLSVLVVLAIVVAAGAVAYAYHRRRQLEEVRGILGKAIDELLAGSEYAGTIFLAYRRLSAHLAHHGFIEKKEDTAREFATGVRRALPIKAESLRVLIRLFEEARYSDHEVGADARDRAVESLTGVRSELDAIVGRHEAAPAQAVPA